MRFDRFVEGEAGQRRLKSYLLEEDGGYAETDDMQTYQVVSDNNDSMYVGAHQI